MGGRDRCSERPRPVVIASLVDNTDDTLATLQMSSGAAGGATPIAKWCRRLGTPVDAGPVPPRALAVAVAAR